MGKSKDLATGASAFYQDQTESDARYVNVSGDTMTGVLNVNTSDSTPLKLEATGANCYIKLANNNDGNGTFVGGETTNINLWTDNTKRLNIDSSGRVTMPYQPAFMVTMNTSPTLTGTTEQILTWNSEIFDIGSNFNTSNYRFTAPVNGLYHMHIHFELHSDSNWTNSTWAYIGDYFINGTRATGADYWGHSYKYNLATNAAILQLNANDYVDVRAIPNSNTIRYSAGGYGNSRWFGHLIG